MSIKVMNKKVATHESVEGPRMRARRMARMRAEALKALRAKKREEDGEEDIRINADTAEVLYTDQDKNLQVIVGEDPTEGGIVVAVATAEKDNLEDEEVLASVTVSEDGEVEPGAGDSLSIEEARKAIRARLHR